jgi:hypothetical protein
MSGKLGDLMPVMALECLPGDKWEIGADLLVKTAPMVAPIMHRVDVSVHYFFVPNRITWANWERFITNGSSTDGDVAPVWPYLDIDGTELPATQRLLDYMGIPPHIPGGTDGRISALPLAAYNKIYSDYYRDQNLEPLIAPGLIYPGTILNDGNNSFQKADWGVRQRSWEHDYFTSALPWAQKGGEVVIPYNQEDLRIKFANASTNAVLTAAAPVGSVTVPFATSNNDQQTANTLFADVSETANNAPSINDLRRAYKIQEWLEKNARGGTRYIENILIQFGVKSSDARLQRAEYITGVKSPIIISEVLNTSGNTSIDSPEQGNMSGHGVSVSGGNVGSYYCEEHGYIIGVMSIIPKPAYQQGIAKQWLKNDPLDYAFPVFAHLGEQPIQNQELYAYGTTPEATFGYTPRYSEYKFVNSRVAGDFRTTLDYWHLGRIFNSQPLLNKDFINVQPNDTRNIFGADDPEVTDSFYIHILNKIGTTRKLPKYGTPAW